MLSQLNRFRLYFSPYINSTERKTDHFMNGLIRNASKKRVRKNLTQLMEKDMIAVQLWFERVFRGYANLNKKVRQKAYQNAQIQRTLFNPESFDLKDDARSRLKYLKAINDFYHKSANYQYKKNVDFASTLKDPRLQAPEGDCNQMVTLYAWLYAERFPITDLEIKVFPAHVCLHFRGIDIEVTNGKFLRYRNKEARVLPITDLMAINLVDSSAKNQQSRKVNPKTAFQVYLLLSLLETYPKVSNHNLKVGAQIYLNQLIQNYQKMDSKAKKGFNLDLYRELKKVIEEAK